MPIVYLTRRETFCASHRLYSAELSEEENEILFDKCCNPSGHGHNYVLKVTLRGEPDPKTGIIMNLVDMKKIIREEVIDKLDHKYVNVDVPEFKTVNPTVENVAIVIWNLLNDKLPALYEVEVHETENNVAVYQGE